jgi:hypothetical protein
VASRIQISRRLGLTFVATKYANGKASTTVSSDATPTNRNDRSSELRYAFSLKMRS